MASQTADIQALLQAGLTHYAAGDLNQAESAYRQVLAHKPDQPDALHLLGRIACDRGDHDVALAQLQRAVAQRPDAAIYHRSLAETYVAAGRPLDAIAAYQTSLRLKSPAPRVSNELGNLLAAAGRLDEAEAAYRAALAAEQDVSHAAYNLANLLRSRGALEEATTFYARAVAARPDFAEAHFNMGHVLANRSQWDAALTCYRRAFALKPESAIIAGGLATLLLDANRTDEAMQVLAQASNASRDPLGFRLRAQICLPRIYRSWDHIREVRARVTSGLDEFARTEGVIHNPPEVMTDALFYLAYAGDNDRPLMEAAHRLFRAHSPVLNYTSPHLREVRARKDSRIRIGMVSQHLWNHTIGKLNRGLIAQLDRSKFHVTVIHSADARHDDMRRAIDRAADEVVSVPADLAAAQKIIADLRLDLLHFPDIGMTPFTYFLAYARLAPVQTVSWGHPDTTGLDTIDYFLSFAAGEPEDADTAYSETLIRFARPSVFYEPDAYITERMPRADFGLPAEGRLYGCLQSLFKFHPDFDDILAGVIARDPGAWIVTVEGTNPAWKEILRRRWADRAPILCERVLFLPRQAEDRFKHLVANMDLLLDPVHFGGGNTFYEAMAQGVPTVTWPGHYFRGRIIVGLYRLLGLQDPPIVENLADYAEYAVALARDTARRNKISDFLRENGAALYRDNAAVREVESFFHAAVNAARKGETVSAF